MGLYSIKLTPEDALAQQGIFQQELADLLGRGQITILPPFPDYSLISQSHSPKILLKVVNEVVLSRRPAFDEQQGWLLLPLLQSNKVVGVLFLEDVDPRYYEAGNLAFLERITRLCIDKLQWKKKGLKDAETKLWRREVLMREVSHAVEVAENHGSLLQRRLLDDRPKAMHFTFICFVVTPAPEPWGGAGRIWQKLGPRLAESLPAESLAAHLGGGYVGVFWPRASVEEATLYAQRLQSNLSGGEGWNLAAGVASFPEDFYDNGPSLPWEKRDLGERLMAAEEVIRRASLAAEVANSSKEEQILTYHALRERGLVKRDSPFEQRLLSVLTSEEPGALLLIKLDDWQIWQRQHGSKGAAARAERVLEASKNDCPAGSIVDWAGPDRIGLFLPDADVNAGEERGISIRQRVRTEFGTTVQIGISVHPCPGFKKREMLENARKALTHAGFFGPDTQILFDAVSLNISGDRLYDSGQMEEAVHEFKRALALDPNNVNVGNSLGVCYAQMGKSAEAVTVFSRLTTLKPDDFMAQYNLGCGLLSLERMDEAERAFIRAAELEPDNGAVCFQLAKLCKKLNRLEEALVHLKRTVDLQPNWAEAWRLLGEYLLQKGSNDEALFAFKSALKINGKDATALSGLAALYARTEFNQEIALSLARRSVELEPDNILLLERLIELLLQYRELDQAQVMCERAITTAPDNEKLRQLQEEIAENQRALTS